jgi:hypothetical protein
LGPGAQLLNPGTRPGGAGFVSQFRKSDLDFSPKLRQVTDHDHPHLSQVEAEVLMDQYVPHDDHLGPRDFRVPFAKRRGKSSGGFADDL